VKAALAALALLVTLSARGGSAGAGVSLGEWVKVLAGGKTKCARGGPYSYWLRKGDPERLLVFFQGGGGCFDERTCAVGSSWFDDRIDVFDDPAYNGGTLRIRAPSSLRAAAPAASVPRSMPTRSSGGIRGRGSRSLGTRSRSSSTARSA
jgi:hypothetical protein